MTVTRLFIYLVLHRVSDPDPHSLLYSIRIRIRITDADLSVKKCLLFSLKSVQRELTGVESGNYR